MFNQTDYDHLLASASEIRPGFWRFESVMDNDSFGSYVTGSHATAADAVDSVAIAMQDGDASWKVR